MASSQGQPLRTISEYCPSVTAIKKILFSSVTAFENCICDLRTWMLQDKLKINGDKTEFIIIRSKKQLSNLDECSIRVGSTDVFPVNTVENIGSWFDLFC